MLQAGSILIFLALLGYIVGDFFDNGYIGRTYKPKGGDFGRFLHYSSRGLIILVFISIIILLLYNPIIPIFASIFFPQVTPQLLLASVFTYLILLVVLEFIIVISPFFGKFLRFLKERISPMEVIIHTNDKEPPIVASEIYDENADFFFYLDKNGNWGLIKKSLVNRIESERKKSIKLFSKQDC